MLVDRTRVTTAFKDYVSGYNLQDGKIALKVAHTLRVASLCDQIAQAEGFTPYDCDVAWFCGMLHDIGRFEQVRRWGTFFDSASVNHAEFGADLLFGEALHQGEFAVEAVEASVTNGIPTAKKPSTLGGTALLRRFCDDCDPAVEPVIRNHNRLQIEEGLDERTCRLCDVLRDADKVDILRVNVERPAEEIYGSTLDEIMITGISSQVEHDFYQCRCINRAHMETLLDRRVGHLCFIYELVYPRSLELMLSQGFFNQALAVTSPDAATEEKLKEMRRFLTAWIEKRSAQ